MAGTYLNFPFDADVFMYQWNTLKDPEKEAILSSGAMVEDANLANIIANGSDIYSMPFYNLLDTSMEPDNYDGATNIRTSTVSGTSMTGVVFGRTHGFTAKDFIKDFNSGADPMKVIVNNVAKYWRVWNQKHMLAILNAILSVTGNEEWTAHTKNLAATGGGGIEAKNAMGISTIGDFAQETLGDNRDAYGLVIMHSKVARNLENQELLKFRVNTDENGIQRRLRIADINGITALVTDNVPVGESETPGAKEYTTYILGGGILRHATASVSHPVTTSRKEDVNGGEEYLWTRNRQTIHPYGFSFKKPQESYTASPTLAQLGDKNNWQLVEQPKVLPIGKIITNG